MEQHPVPQHIASFQFKLFGNLTIRQFITLAIPMSVAVLTFFSPLPAVIRLPLALVIGLFALFSALIPIQGRPLDKWIVAFIKAVTSPTQRVWVKETRVPEYLNIVTSRVSNQDLNQEPVTAQGRERLDAYLRTLPQRQASPLDTKEQIALQRLGLSPQIATHEALPNGKLPPVISWPTKTREEGQFLAPESLPQLGEATSVHAAPRSSPKIAHFAKPYAIPGLEKRLKQQEPFLEAVNIAPSNVKTRLASEANFTVENIISIKTPGENTKLIHGVGKTRTRKLHFAPPEGFDLSKLPIVGERRFEISEELKKRFGGQDSQETTLAPVENTPAAPQETMQSIVPPTPSAQNPIANPIGSTPNVVSGFIKNNDGTPIENVILIVKDRDGVPVRALKTNKNGQFLSTTPLPNGTYIVEIESQAQQAPHTLQMDLNGQIVNPMEIKLGNDS